MTGSDDLNSKIKGLRIGADDFLLSRLMRRNLWRVSFRSSVLKAFTVNCTIKIFSWRKNLILPNGCSSLSFQKIFSDKVSFRQRPLPSHWRHRGDFFDYYPLPDGSYGFLIADVTGHGIPAALVMTMAKMIFSIYATRFTSTSELFSIVNDQMSGLLLDTQYVTSFLLSIIIKIRRSVIQMPDIQGPFIIAIQKERCSHLIPLDIS